MPPQCFLKNRRFLSCTIVLLRPPTGSLIKLSHLMEGFRVMTKDLRVLRRFLKKILPYGTRPDYTLAFLTSNPFVRCSGVHTCPTPAIASVPLARTESRYPLSCRENDGSHTARL